MASLLQWVPGAGLLRQAWDATKLAGAIIDRRQQRAVVLAKERQTQVAPYRGKNATRRVREVIEEGDPAEVARLFVPEAVVTSARAANFVFWRIWDIYWIFAALRVALVLLPQQGYIHPDEFFQTVEVVAGDVLGLDVTRTWEFNSTSPLRSLALPMVAYGGPLAALRGISLLLDHFWQGATLVSSYTVLLVPRLTMLAASFVVDFCVYQVCVLYKHSYNRCLTTLASSYVMLVYSTRTLTNSLEMALASLLFYLVALCMKRSSESVLLQSLVKEEYDKADSVREKVKVRKKQRVIPNYDFSLVVPIGFLCAVGFFNRPTFAAFALVPVFFWLQRGLQVGSYFQPFMIINFRAAALLLVALVTGAVLVLADSLYYGHLTPKKLWDLDLEWTDWKVAPLQFILYNVVPGNLDKHGTHPLYLHAAVNIPLLFGPLGLCAHWSVANFLASIFHNRWGLKPDIRSVSAFAAFSYAVGLAALSVFPHQEPRFLLPLIVPVVLLGANSLRYRVGGWRPLLTIWYAFNIGLTIFYGLVHQGGVLPAVRYLGEGLELNAGTAEVSVVFSRTYMPPKFPLLQAKSPQAVPYLHRDSVAHLTLIDLAGAPTEDVVQRLTTLTSRADYLKAVKKMETLLVAPKKQVHGVVDAAGRSLSFSQLYWTFPHLSTEAGLPEPEWDLLAEALAHPMRSGSPRHVLDFLDSLFGGLSLAVYRVETGAGVQRVEVKTERASHS